MVGSIPSQRALCPWLTAAAVSASIPAKALAFLLIAVVVSAILSCGGGEDQVGADLISLLPQDGDITGFAPAGEPETYDSSSIRGYFGAGADIYLRNGFQALARREYKSSDGAEHLVAELFEFENSKQGFALYSIMRKPEFEQVAVGAMGLFQADTLLALKGNYLIKVYSPSGEMIPELGRAAEVMAGNINTDEPLPKELQLFPREGLMEGSMRLTTRDFLGQTELTDVFSATYLIDSQTLGFSFRLGSNNYVADVVKEYIGRNGVVTGINIEGPNQELSGENTDLGKLYSSVRDGALCFVSGFSDISRAKQLAGQFYDNLRDFKTEQ